AAATSSPYRVIGMHFTYPVAVMKREEMIRRLQTRDDSFRVIETTAKALGKTPVEVNDAQGFVSNSVIMPMINEAIFTVQEGIATTEDVVTVMKLGMIHHMSPIRLAKYIDLDTCLYNLDVHY